MPGGSADRREEGIDAAGQQIGDGGLQSLIAGLGEILDGEPVGGEDGERVGASPRRRLSDRHPLATQVRDRLDG